MSDLTPADIDAIVWRTRDHWAPILGPDGARIVADQKRRRLEAHTAATEPTSERKAREAHGSAAA